MNELIEQHIEAGWSPVGTLIYTQGMYWPYVQAMCKYKEGFEPQPPSTSEQPRQFLERSIKLE